MSASTGMQPTRAAEHYTERCDRVSWAVCAAGFHDDASWRLAVVLGYIGRETMLRRQRLQAAHVLADRLATEERLA